MLKKWSWSLWLILGILCAPLGLAANSRPNTSELLTGEKLLPLGDLKQIAYVKKLLDSMYAADQELRQSLLEQDVTPESSLGVLKDLAAVHTPIMKEILREWGWIIISKFGKEYEHKAWLLVQHADEDPWFQAGVLYVLENLVVSGETDQKNYAYLYDRVAVKFKHLGMRQRYGTQVRMVDKQLILEPYAGSLEDVDQRRSEVGLGPLKDYLSQLRKVYRL